MFLISDDLSKKHSKHLVYIGRGISFYWDDAVAHITFWLWILAGRLDRAIKLQADHVVVPMIDSGNVYHFMPRDKNGGD